MATFLAYAIHKCWSNRHSPGPQSKPSRASAQVKPTHILLSRINYITALKVGNEQTSATPQTNIFYHSFEELSAEIGVET